MEELAIKLTNVEVEFNGREVLNIPDLQIYQNDRIGIIGDNGAGKTTLVKLLSGQLSPTNGEVSRHSDIKVFDQLPQESELISNKSGGENSKKRLTQIIYSDYVPALAFDEPTNHLDSDGINWLISELEYYYGLLLIVSHDQFFLDKTIDKIIEVKDGRISLFSGNLSDFLKNKEEEQKHLEKNNLTVQKEKQRLEMSLKKKQASIAQARKKSKSKNKKDTKPDRLSSSKQKDTVEKSANKVMKSIEKRLDNVGNLEKISIKKKIQFPRIKSKELHAAFPIIGDHFELIVEGKTLIKPCDFSFQKDQKNCYYWEKWCRKDTIIESN